MYSRHLEIVPQGQTWIRGVVLNNERWMRTVETRDSDELDHRYYLWSDYDSYFISNPFLAVVYLFRVKKKVYTYSEIFLDQHYNLLYSCTLVHLEVRHTEFGTYRILSNHFF